MLESRGAIAGARVLDLYAGTGALGLEALSRGAIRATFVEKRREAVAALRSNIADLGVSESTRLVSRSVESASGGESLGGPFDLVFADPPYADVQSGTALRALGRLLEALPEASPPRSRPHSRAPRHEKAPQVDHPPHVSDVSDTEPARTALFLADSSSLLVLEHASKTATPELPGLSCVATRTYGDTQISVYARAESHPAAHPSPDAEHIEHDPSKP